MIRRQPARNPFSFKKITLTGPTGGGGVSGGSEEGSVSGSASNNHLEKNESSIPQSDTWKDSRERAVHITQNIFYRQGFFGGTTCICALLHLVLESPASASPILRMPRTTAA